MSYSGLCLGALHTQDEVSQLALSRLCTLCQDQGAFIPHAHNTPTPSTGWQLLAKSRWRLPPTESPELPPVTPEHALEVSKQASRHTKPYFQPFRSQLLYCHQTQDLCMYLLALRVPIVHTSPANPKALQEAVFVLPKSNWSRGTWQQCCRERSQRRIQQALWFWIWIWKAVSLSCSMFTFRHT